MTSAVVSRDFQEKKTRGRKITLQLQLTERKKIGAKKKKKKKKKKCC
jgi:hypothetical protein